MLFSFTFRPSMRFGPSNRIDDDVEFENNSIFYYIKVQRAMSIRKLSHVESRVEQQLKIMNLVANSYDNLIKVGLLNINSQRIHTRITSLKESWEKFDLNHDAITLAIIELTPSDKRLLHSHSYFVDNLYSMTYECL